LFSYKISTIIYSFMLKKKKGEMLFMLLSYFSILEFIKKEAEVIEAQLKKLINLECKRSAFVSLETFYCNFFQMRCSHFK